MSEIATVGLDIAKNVFQLHEKLDKIHGDLCLRLEKRNGPR